jgi:hypothetical protein
MTMFNSKWPMGPFPMFRALNKEKNIKKPPQLSAIYDLTLELLKVIK